eukprot:403339050
MTDQQPGEPAQQLQPGLDKGEFYNKVVRDYRILKPIGEGKFSVVFKAQKVSDGSPVALKILKIFDMNDQKQREKCMKEVKLLEKLQHDFIIRYIESFIEQNEMFIVVEWAEKGDLKYLVRQAAARQQFLEERRVWNYLWQIASALRHMFQVRIMHRDLKPANIFIDANDNLKLGDLGLGRDFTSQTMEAYSRVGTPLYMSPEVLQGSGYDFKSDVWSLGCITYELCALKSPFKDETKKMSLYDLFTKINQGVYAPLSASRYSSELRYMIDCMLRVDPQERVDINDVVTYCEKHIAQLNKQEQQETGGRKVNRMDPILIMDDIIEKLHLLDYQSKFCKEKQRKPISRTYFAIKTETEPSDDKVRNFVEISYWLMSLYYESQIEASSSKPGSKNGRFKSNQDAVDQLLIDVKKFKVSLPEHFTSRQLIEGYGEGVCYIVNDLTNRELIRRKFKFEEFKVKDHQNQLQLLDEEEDDIIQGSHVFISPSAPMHLVQQKIGSKDLTDQAMIQKNQKRQFFKLLNEEDQSQDDFHTQFQDIMSQSLKGRTNDLFKSGGLNARTGSTATSENTQLITTFNQTRQLKSNFQELATLTQDIIQTAIDPEEWRKEVDRVKDQLNYKLNGNQPEHLSEDMEQQLQKIRLLENRITSQSIEQINKLKTFQQDRTLLVTELQEIALATDQKLQISDQLEFELATIQDNIEVRLQDQSDDSKIRNMRKQLSDLKSQVNKMHQTEGILRIAAESQSVKLYFQQKERFKQKDQRKRRNQSLRITGSNSRQSNMLVAIQEVQNDEDDEEFYEKNKRSKSGNRSRQTSSKSNKIPVDADDLKRMVDEDEEYSWDSDFD